MFVTDKRRFNNIKYPLFDFGMETVSTSPQVKYLFCNDDLTFSPMCTEVIVIVRESMLSFKWKYTLGHRNPKTWFKRCCLFVCCCFKCVDARLAQNLRSRMC